MPNKFARSNGDFNDPSIWSGLAASMSATSVPTIGDNASSNTFTIQITGNVACDNITNGNIYGGTAQGNVGFGMNNNSSLAANVIGPSGSSSNHCVSVSGTNCTIIGNIVGGNNGDARGCIVTGSVVIYGNITSSTQTTTNGLTNNGTATIYGNLIPNVGGPCVTNSGNLTVFGNVRGSASSSFPGINNTGSGSLQITGNLEANVASAFWSSNAAANVRISGNLIGAPNGIPAVYAASYTVNPVPYQTYIRYANNGTGVGSDAYLYHYTTDSLSAFSMPPLSAVRAGLQYANNTLTGTCQMPAASAVTFGALVDNTTGTAAITSNTLFDVSVASLTASDSLGARLKNSATVESVGKIIASFSN